jgi:hypothetical protein
LSSAAIGKEFDTGDATGIIRCQEQRSGLDRMAKSADPDDPN